MNAQRFVDIRPDLREWTLAELYGSLDRIDDLIGPWAMRVATEIDRRAYADCRFERSVTG